MFNSIRERACHLFRWRNWERQACELPNELISNNGNFKEINITHPLLIIAPHADDELIGCHQLIKNASSRVVVFYCSYLGSNYSNENRLIREKEIISYTSSHSCELIISSPEHVSVDLSDTIKSLNPERIFLPSVVDWHPEHRQINFILKEVLSNMHISCEIVWYHISLPMPAFSVNACTPMSKKQFIVKWRTMRQYYQSQLHMDIKRFQFIERIFKSENFAMEAYISMSYSKWTGLLEQIISKDYHFDSLKQSLGDVNKMFIETADYYISLQI